jgi:hypothetical protein
MPLRACALRFGVAKETDPMGRYLAGTNDLAAVAQELAPFVEDPTAVVWVSVLDAQDLFARQHDAEEARRKEARHVHLAQWAVRASFQGRVVPRDDHRLYDDAVFAVFANRPGDADPPTAALHRAVAAAIALREDCARWNVLNSWKPYPPPDAGWQYQIHPRVGIAGGAQWPVALCLAAQARRGEILLEESAWELLGGERSFLQPRLAGVRFGVAPGPWQRGWEASQRAVADVRAGLLDGCVAAEIERLGLLAPLPVGAPG